MGPFVLAEAKFPFGASSSFLSGDNTGAKQAEPATPTSTVDSEDFGDSEDHTVEVIHSSPGRRSIHYHKHRNDLKTTTITSTRTVETNMSLQLDRYGFITNIDSKGQIMETNGAESIKVPSFADSQRTERREKKWKATLQTWDKQNHASKNQPHNDNDDDGDKHPLPRQAQFTNNKVVIRRLRKGIPDSIRGRTWVALGGGVRVPGMYQRIVELTSNAMLENCRELQRVNKRKRQQQQQQQLLIDGDSEGDEHTSLGGNRTPEKMGIQLNNSNRTSPTASEASTLTNVSPTKAPKSPAITDHNDNNEDDDEGQKNYAATRDFRSIQDIIERDIHRTFPRHNLFYEEERCNPQPMDTDAEVATHNSISAFVDDSQICDPELAALVLNLEMDLRIAGENASNTENMDGLQQFAIHDKGNHYTIQATTQSGQAALRRVLRAYSYYDPEVGYCQGMNFIAGMFLTLMKEEEAFWLLVSVMSDKPCRMRGLFGEGMLHTHKVLYVAEKLIHYHLSRLAKHFEKEHVHVTMYATQWLLTQYTSSFKFDLVVRVWDAFLGEGWKIIYRIMLALLQKYQSQLLKMSFEEILTFFRELPEKVEGGQIMDMALKIPLRRKVIAKYEKEWESKQKQQQQ